MCSVASPSIHPFEQAGHGKAPFRFVGYEDKYIVHNAGSVYAYVQPAGTCDYCGQGIRYCCHIQSSDGKRFIVGQDCVRKLNREDNRMLSDLDRAIAQQKQAVKEAKAEKRRQEWNAKREAVEAEQRAKNNGLTDYELAQKERKEKADAQRSEWSSKNAWIIEVLQMAQPGDFVDAMIENLSVGDYKALSYRCRDIIAQIWAKQKSGRSRASKAYGVALDDFYAKAGVEVDDR